MVIDLNLEIEEYGDDFDYRGKLRDEEWVKGTRKHLVGEYRKQVAREKIQSFSQEWEASK